MPRPRILRNVNSLPPCKLYGPLDQRTLGDIITMSIEEYETIRLIDEQNMNQAECAIEMGVGRTTAQRIYNDARRKIAHALVYGKAIQFEGGDYTLRGQGQSHGRRHQGHGMGRNRLR